jgi:hypothetical protein
LEQQVKHLDYLQKQKTVTESASIELQRQQENFLIQEQKIQAQQKTITDLNDEIASLREQLSKSTKDLTRLRGHLLETEENHTLEIMNKEETIQQLTEEYV